MKRLYYTTAWTMKGIDVNKLEAFELWRLLRISWVERVTTVELTRLDRKKEVFSKIERKKSCYRKISYATSYYAEENTRKEIHKKATKP